MTPAPRGSAGLALSTQDLSVGYRTGGVTRRVLEAINVAVAAGELVGLLGPNGIGKSTLLRSVAKLHPLIGGTVMIGGQNIGSLSQIELARLLGVVLTDRVEARSLPAYKVVELGRYPHLSWLGNLTAHDHAVVEWAIRAVGAEHLATREIGHLSDGERQRLMVARALAQEPAVLLLDEPTAFLDLPGRVELVGLLRQLAREQKLAVVFSTHDLELALRTADTIWLLTSDGLRSGSPEDIVWSGALAKAFSSDRIQFEPGARMFRLLTSAKGTARVEGQGLGAVLAQAVLEREGFRSDNSRADLLVAVHDGCLWNAVCGSHRGSGQSFADLAEFARGLKIPVEAAVSNQS